MKRSWGQVPTRNERHTLGSVMDNWAWREEAPAPMSCSMGIQALVLRHSEGSKELYRP